MTKQSASSILWIILTTAFLEFSTPTFGEINDAGNIHAGDSMSTNENSDANNVNLLNQAHNLLRKASGLEYSSDDSERQNLLIQARKLIKQVPPNQAIYQGHRKMAILDIRSALQTIKSKASAKQIEGRIRKADIELCTAISLLQKK